MLLNVQSAGCKKIILIMLLAYALLFLNAGGVLAHGVELEFTERSTIEVTARYDSGGPMAGAQVAVFAPGSPAEPWLTGVCDSSGRFFFVPDPAIPGLWEVQVRLAGHGGLIRIELAEGNIEPSRSTGFSGLQILIMAAAVIWGFVGTALFYSRKRA
ncbi:MAG: carboxypeptidase regulatory-like domain-containing protein [Dethiobacteria bacterium]